MSEQFWYTWSTSGFGTANGNRVRAASANLTDVEGQRVRSFINLVSYMLSQDVDPFLPPHEAPLCLAFLKAGSKQESVLIRKTYAGLDGIKRPGAYFSHLLADLPSVPSPCPGGQIPFSAREAIQLWQSTTLWRNTEDGWPASKRDLEAIPSADLYSGKHAGPLNEQSVMQMPSLFGLVMQAFLTLALTGERKRLYLAGSPDTVATLIWGITHALPRTLNIMRDLTFSTFEADIEGGARPLIVGTCWLPQYLKKGHENALLDLPALYYQANNPYGIAINCYAPHKQTPVAPQLLITKYTQFVLDCFSQGYTGQQDLKTMVDEAEKRNISEIPALFNHYISYQDNLPKEEVMRILQALYDKMGNLINRASAALQQDKLPDAAAEAEQMGNIELEAEDIRRENVLRSIIGLMRKNPTWWQNQGQPMISKLHQLSGWYTSNQLVQLENAFLEKIISSRTWQKKQGADVITAVQPLFTGPPVLPQEMLTTFALNIRKSVLEAQKELRTSLFPLAEKFIKQLVQALQADQPQSIVFWNHAFESCAVNSRLPLDVEVSLLQQLADLPYTSAYAQWYRSYGQNRLHNILLIANKHPDSDLNKALFAFTQQTVSSLEIAIRSSHLSAIAFWKDMLLHMSPYTSQPALWGNLLFNLCDALSTPGFNQWWIEQGREATRYLSSLAEANRGTITDKFSAFRQAAADLLTKAIIQATQQGKHDETWITFLFDILTVATPAQESHTWLALLQNLSSAYVYRNASWELRAALLQRWKQVAILNSSETPALLHSWFEVSWNDLGTFLALDLPDAWSKIAIARALETYSVVSPGYVFDVVGRYQSLFEQVLQTLIKVYPKQPLVIRFFNFLAQNGYANLISLLDGLLAAIDYQRELAEALLQAAQLTTDQDITNLLEQHCQKWLTSYELTPTMLRLIEHYLAHFDIEYLDTDPTRALLQRLLQRENVPHLRLPHQLHQLVEGWYQIAEFLAYPQVSHNALRALSHSMRNMTQLVPDVQKKLAVKLIPHLVELVITEADLTRVIDNLGRGRELQLLQDMARVTGEKYGQERAAERLVPYVKMILGEARYLEFPEKEQFIDTCFQLLFIHIDGKTRDKFKSDALWPKAFVEEWKSTLGRSRNADLNKELDHFREAAGQLFIPEIIARFEAAFEPYLTADERQLVVLARRFMMAYDTENDAGILQAHETLQQYYSSPKYMQEHVDRILLAHQHLAEQQASAPQQVVNVSNSAVESGGKAANLATWQGGNATDSGSTPAQVSSPRSSMPIQNMTPSTPAVNQSYVATVKTQRITAHKLHLALELQVPYLKRRKNIRIKDIQRLETQGMDKKEYRAAKQELKEIDKLLRDEEQLRQATLDYLIEDVLIEQEIGRMSTNQQGNLTREVENRLERFYQEITVSYQRSSSSLQFQDPNTIKNVKTILRIFLWRELFAAHLQLRGEELENWLKVQKQQEKDNISIDYEQARVKADRGGLKLPFRR